MSPIRTKPFIHLRHLLLGSLTLLLVGGAILYVLFQARFLIAGPQVALTAEPNFVQNERQIILEGNAENITEISLNGRAIVTSEAGDFKEAVVLENGSSIVRIDATDRYGRTTSVERTFVYIPTETTITLSK